MSSKAPLITLDPFESLQSDLQTAVDRKYCLVTGNATTALMAACSTLPESRSKVIVPAISCINLLYAVHYSGKAPVLADVCLEDATVDPEHVKRLLEDDPEIGAVFAVHLYGHEVAMDTLGRLCRKHEVLLIEDVAQAQGGEYGAGGMYGSKGDMAIYSFGHTKIVDAGYGGAMLLDDPGLKNKARAAIMDLSPAHPERESLAHAYSREYYAAWNLYKSKGLGQDTFYDLPGKYMDLFLFALDPEQGKRISNLLPTLESELVHRRMLHSRYQQLFSEIPGIEVFDVNSNKIAPWRFSFRVKQSKREEVLEALRSNSFHASSWYPCLKALGKDVADTDSGSLPNAMQIEKEIVNLWLTSKQDESEVKQQAGIIKDVLLQ